MNQYSSLTGDERETRFWANVDIKSAEDCWNWKASLFPNGYGQTSLGPSGNGQGAHRVAVEYTSGPIPEGMHILHKCDNKRCCNPSHLKIGTHQENMDDRERSGLTVRGEKHRWYGVPKTKEERQRFSEAHLGKRKHSSDLIEKIRAEIGTKSLQSLAKQFQVSKSYVQRIGAGHI